MLKHCDPSCRIDGASFPLARTLTNLLALAPFLACLLCAQGRLLSAQTPTAVPVLTWRYDITHAGQNTSETALTPANVNVKSFGKLFSRTVDSSVYAQPLYVPALKMSDGFVHNVLFVATENDSIYAFDADSNGGINANPIWQISMLNVAHGAKAAATAVPWGDTGSPDIAPTLGITGTPTIDPATNTMYVVAVTKEGGAYYSRLHAINIINGAEQPHSPVVVTATADGTGDGSSGGKIVFDALMENQRTALNFYNGYVYFGYAAQGDNRPWHGWLFAYNAATLAQSAALCLSPNDHGAGVWEAGAGMPIDDDATGGRMFLATGNGALSSYPPFKAGGDWSMSILNINLANGGLTLTDGFTSFNYDTLNTADLDQGSGGILMVPDQQGTHKHILVQVGKEGRILVLNRDDLGGNNSGKSSNAGALQDFTSAITYGQGLWSTPAYWNGNVYMWPEKSVPMLFKLNSGVMDTTPSSKGTISSDFPGASFSISANGTLDGVAWAERTDQFNTDGPAILYAWDANDLSKTIYESDTDSARDIAGTANRYSIPVVTNGKVYVAAVGQIDVYGLFNGTPTAAEPIITPDGGTFSASATVTLSTATANAEIYYTLDGSTPTPASKQYTEPIELTTDTTINAITSAPGYVQSAIRRAAFTFSDQTPPLKFRPAGGTYLAAQKVTISDSDSSAKIYYTTNGSIPSASSKVYMGPISVLVSETIKAVAISPKLHNSNIGSSAYVIQQGGSSINFGSGFSSTAGLTLNGSAVATDDTRLQLTTGGLWQGGSVWWNAPINIQAFTTSFEFQLSAAQANGFTFTIQNVGTKALGGDSAGLGYQNILKSVAVKFNIYNYENEGDNSTGVYTNGEPPTTPTVNLTPSGIILASGDVIEAKLTYNGVTLTLSLHDTVTNDNFSMTKVIDIPQTVGADTAYVGFTGGTGGLSASQKLLTWTYSTQALPPTFTPVAGTYQTEQRVALRSATTDAAIYFTINGTAPTAASAPYSAQIAVTSSETIKAIAISPTKGSSNVEAATYVIRTTASFSLTASAPKTVVQGGTTASTITITPKNDLSGDVALTCAVTAKPLGAVDVPTCSIPQSKSIAGTMPAKVTLTANTRTATTAGAYSMTVTGTLGNVVEKVRVAITVNKFEAALEPDRQAGRIDVDPIAETPPQ